MAQAVGKLTKQGSEGFDAVIPILSRRLNAETAKRQASSASVGIKELYLMLLTHIAPQNSFELFTRGVPTRG